MIKWNFDTIDKSIGLVKTLHEKTKGKKIVLWGAGITGRKVHVLLEMLGFRTEFFVDRSYLNYESVKIFDKAVVAPSHIMQKDKNNDIFVIVATQIGFYNEIKKTLIQGGLIEFADFMHCLYFDERNYEKEWYDVEVRSMLAKHCSKSMPMFCVIEIETINRCNLDCEFCPVNKNVDTRELKLMPEELYDSILQQLQDINYSGRFQLSSNNEPFMDKNIISRMAKAREMLPNAHIFLLTNGTLLTLEKFKTAMKYLDNIVIDNYSNDYEFQASIKEIYEHCKANMEIGERVKILKRRKDEKLNTRAGQSPNREKIHVSDTTCLLPFMMMVVRPDGKISLCCNDARGQCTLGDLKEEKIMDVWHGKKFAEIRENILIGRETLPLCSACDAQGSMPSENWKYIDPPTSTPDTLLEVWYSINDSTD